MILYFSIKDGQRFGGAVEDPERIAEIQEDDLLLLEGCTHLVSAADNDYKAPWNLLPLNREAQGPHH